MTWQPKTQMDYWNWAMGWVNFLEEFFPDSHTPITARTFPG